MTIHRIFSSFIILGLVVFGLSVNSADAQTNVALVDIGMVFKSHPNFSKDLQQLKLQADQFKEETRLLQQQLVSEAEILKQYQPDSAEFRRIETELAQKSAALEVQQQGKLRELMKSEAQLHYQTYMQIKEAVSSYCQQRGVKLVLRHDSTPMQEDQPATIMQKVNGKIVFHKPANDITEEILATVAQGAGTTIQK